MIMIIIIVVERGKLAGIFRPSLQLLPLLPETESSSQLSVEDLPGYTAF
jgi:hypothetical protein